MAIANNQIETNENKNKEKEVKQYIVVQIGSESTELISAMSIILCVCRNYPCAKGTGVFQGNHQSSRRIVRL